MLIWGRSDQLVPLQVAHQARSLRPELPLVILDHSGHCPHDEVPQAFNAALLAWLKPRQLGWFAASLDHAMWFHRPMRADDWQLYDVSCVTYAGGRGLTVGHIYAPDGNHVSTFTQEVIIRPVRA
jgi:hypothetical protein